MPRILSKKKGDERPGHKAAEEKVQESMKPLEEMNVDEFMNSSLLGGLSDDDEEVASDEEDIDEEGSEEEEEGGDLDEKPKKKSTPNAARGHQAELEKLAQSDPEFHKFLQENTPNLLDFAADDEVDDSEESSDEDDDAKEETEAEGQDDAKEETEAPKAKKVLKRSTLTIETIRDVDEKLSKNHAVSGLKRLLSMYRAGCMMGTSDGDESLSAAKYEITSAAVYNQLMVTALLRFHAEFTHHLSPEPEDGQEQSPEELTAHPERKLTKVPMWKSLSSVVKSFLRATLTLVGQISEPSLLIFLLKHLKKYVPYMLPFPQIAKSYAKALLQIWGNHQSEQEGQRHAQVTAFLRLRQLAVTQPFPFIEDCFKGLYLTYARNSKFISQDSLPAITFMGNCVVELFGVDLNSCYQHCFVYVRQLALHLRNAMIKKTKESMQGVFNWQFLNCLKVWTAVVASYPGENELKPLAYPLTQVIMGALRLAQATRLIPFRAHCIRLLNQISAATETFIPTAAMILDTLCSPELQAKPKPSTAKPPQLHALLRFAENDLNTKVVHDTVFSTWLGLLHETIEVVKYNVSFPEFAAPLISGLNRFCKDTRVVRWRVQCKGLVDTLHKNSNKVTLQRQDQGLSMTTDVFEALRPATAPPAGKRIADLKREREGREQSLSVEPQQPIQTKKFTKKRKGDDREPPSDETKPPDTRKKSGKASGERKTNKAASVALEEQADEVSAGFTWDSDDSEE
uniref:Nucleolar complex protein 2 homolog n=2 Tax=Octactis speculum TaxID=3111310 RepID=A0A7S2G439_9STRA|mmetsp:Transcript_38324/g.51917  ORF Transcript_38324/g.51917 Transcript_38324/m.51917 type:complete len:740 (+) Transcript_38324:121-2340(+)